MLLVRELFWISSDEADRLLTGLRAPKPGFEARWEAEVMVALTLLAGLAVAYLPWYGYPLVWLLIAQTLQALIQKGFFDPLPKWSKQRSD